MLPRDLVNKQTNNKLSHLQTSRSQRPQRPQQVIIRESFHGCSRDGCLDYRLLLPQPPTSSSALPFANSSLSLSLPLSLPSMEAKDRTSSLLLTQSGKRPISCVSAISPPLSPTKRTCYDLDDQKSDTPVCVNLRFSYQSLTLPCRRSFNLSLATSSRRPPHY